MAAAFSTNYSAVDGSANHAVEKAGPVTDRAPLTPLILVQSLCVAKRLGEFNICCRGPSEGRGRWLEAIATPGRFSKEQWFR